MNIKNSVLLFILSWLLYSCNNLDGKIETRQQDKVYLVNTSKTKPFKFTVKATIITNDSIYDYNIHIVELQPGDEKYLGQKVSFSETKYPDINVKRLKYYDSGFFDAFDNAVNNYKPSLPKGAILINEDGLPIPNDLIRDTTINGQKQKYQWITETKKDSLHPFPKTRYDYEFEVTGQVEIKSKK